MRKLLSILAVFGMAFAVASTAQAGTFDPANSYINFAFSGLSAWEIYAKPGTEVNVYLADNGSGGHDLTMNASVFSTINFGAGTSLYTGVPGITNIKITAKNAQASFASGYTYLNHVGDGGVKGPYLGGVSSLSGYIVVHTVLGPTNVDIGPIGGSPGSQLFPTLVGISMSATGGPWATGPLTIASITTNVISVNGVTGVGVTLQPPPGAVINEITTGGGLPLEARTVTILGSNNLLSAASQSGAVTLVAPLRVNTTAQMAGRIPMAAKMVISFVPEPGTMLLLVAGAVGLVFVGRRRMRK